MDIIVTRLGKFANISAPRGYYAINKETNEVIKTTIDYWDDNTENIINKWRVITAEEKAEIDALNEEEEHLEEEPIE